jgi:hypothetical protein
MNVASPELRGLALLGKVGAVAGLAAVVLQLFLALTVRGYAAPFGPITLLLVAAAVPPAVMFLGCRNPSCPTGRARALEVFAVIGSSTLYSATLLFFDISHHFDRLAILALTFIAVLRAAIVPSGVVRTIALTAAMAIPLALFVGLSYRGYVARAGDALGATHSPLVMAGWTVIWWSFTTFLSAVVSGALLSARGEG